MSRVDPLRQMGIEGAKQAIIVLPLIGASIPVSKVINKFCPSIKPRVLFAGFQGLILTRCLVKPLVNTFVMIAQSASPEKGLNDTLDLVLKINNESILSKPTLLMQSAVIIGFVVLASKGLDYLSSQLEENKDLKNEKESNIIDDASSQLEENKDFKHKYPTLTSGAKLGLRFCAELGKLRSSFAIGCLLGQI